MIIPLLASEYNDPSNLPVFQNILKQLRDITYLSQIIFGLDSAKEEDALRLMELVRSFGIKNHLLQFNDWTVLSCI